MNEKDFLAVCNMTETDLEKAGMEWSELDAIRREYETIEEHLRELGKTFIDDYLYDIDRAGLSTVGEARSS